MYRSSSPSMKLTRPGRRIIRFAHSSCGSIKLISQRPYHYGQEAGVFQAIATQAALDKFMKQVVRVQGDGLVLRVMQHHIGKRYGRELSLLEHG